jgi:hypothetical protein
VSKYKKGEDVPTHVIINRLNSLSDDVTKGITRNFGMSIPARLDYDADLVLSIAARRLARIEKLEARLATADHLIAELEEHEGAEGWSNCLRDKLDAYESEGKQGSYDGTPETV